MKVKHDIAIVPKLILNAFGERKAVGLSPSSKTQGRFFSFWSCGFYSNAAYVQLEFGESAACIRVRLLIQVQLLYTTLQ